jgi:superoxide reductase
MKFLYCKHCKNVLLHLGPVGSVVFCCGEPMVELVANTTEAAKEKHLPVYEVKDNEVCVKVGSVEHPMTSEHHISWILIETTKGHQLVNLDITLKPEAHFVLAKGEQLLSVYEYCNLHGLWVTKV